MCEHENIIVTSLFSPLYILLLGSTTSTSTVEPFQGMWQLCAYIIEMIHVSCMYVYVLDDDHVCICICCKLQMHESNSRGVQMYAYQDTYGA